MKSDGESGLRAAEVARLLGVKRETVYAYVSRGILHRRMALDGRTSLFDRSEVEELRLGRRTETEGQLRTMLASSITRVSDDGLWVRGHDLVDLVNEGAGYTEVADILWQASPEEDWPPLPTESRRPLTGDAMAGLTLIDQLRVIVAHQSSADPLRHDLSARSVRAAGRRAIVAMASTVNDETAVRGAQSGDHSGGGRPNRVAHGSPLGDMLWPRLTGQIGDDERRRCLDVALALMADHGLATSTFGARVAASVRADPYSVIVAGLGVFGGPLHGAASRDVHDLLVSADRRGRGDIDGAAAAIGEVQRRGKLPGFGHAVYRAEDPRYAALMSRLVEAWAGDERLRIVFRVRDVVGERSDAMPNVDLAIGSLTYLAGMSPGAGEAISAISRTAGWLAHAIEEYDEQPLRFRPKAHYLGATPDTPTERDQPTT